MAKQRTYIVEIYELHTSKFRVKAKSLVDGPQHVHVAEVGGKSRFVGNRLGFPVRHHLPVINALRQLPEVFSPLAELLFNVGQRHLAKLADGLDAQGLEFLACNFTDAPDSIHGQRVEELLDLAIFNDDVAIRLAEIAGHLCNELARCHADRRHQPDLSQNIGFHLAGDHWRRTEKPLAAGHVEEGFIEGKRLDQWRVPLKDFLNLA